MQTNYFIISFFNSKLVDCFTISQIRFILENTNVIGKEFPHLTIDWFVNFEKKKSDRTTLFQT